MSKPIKVCFVCPGATSTFLPELPPTHGGAETQLSWFSRELARRDDFDVHFVVRGQSSTPSKSIDGLTLHFYDHRAGRKAKIELQRVLHRIGAEIYLQQASGSITKEVAFFCLWSRKSFIYWTASNYDVDPVGIYPDLQRHRGFPWAIRRARHILTQTDWQNDQLLMHYGIHGTVIRNAMPARPKSQRSREYILWLARFAKVKQPEYFIDLAESVPEEQFVMVGPATTPDGREILDKLQPRFSTLKNFRYIPGVPINETDAYFESAKLMVLTSSTEGYPNTVMQAMWAGTPIATLSFDPDHLIARERLGIAPAQSVNKLATEIREILSDPERLQAAGERARHFAETHHNIEPNTTRLAEVLHRVAGR